MANSWPTSGTYRGRFYERNLNTYLKDVGGAIAMLAYAVHTIFSFIAGMSWRTYTKAITMVAGGIVVLTLLLVFGQYVWTREEIVQKRLAAMEDELSRREEAYKKLVDENYQVQYSRLQELNDQATEMEERLKMTGRHVPVYTPKKRGPINATVMNGPRRGQTVQINQRDI